MQTIVSIAVILSVLTTMASAQAPSGEAPKKIRFGIQTTQQNVTYEQILAIWKEAEALGFDSAWDFDHFMPISGDLNGPCLEGWTLLAALATQTSKIRIGTLVTGNTYRNPVLVAKMAATVDQISSGRLNLGIGAGWFEPEHVAYNFPFYTPKERIDRLAEALEVISKLWSVDHATWTGQYYSLQKAPFNPPFVQKPHPPIVIGGQGKKWTLPLVARYADAWNIVFGVSPKGMKERVELLHKECARIGRTPCDIEVQAFLMLAAMGDVPRAELVNRPGWEILKNKRIARSVLAGTTTEVTDRIREFVSAGATHIIVNLQPPYDAALLQRFAREVVPAFR